MQSTNLIPITKAADHFPIRPSVSAIWRWALRGTRGAILETVMVGGRRYVTREAIDQFIAATTANGSPDARTITRTSTRRQAEIDRAERALNEAGI